MKLTLTQEFPFSLQRVLEAREKRFDNLDKFPELKNQKLLEERWDGDIRIQKRSLSFGDQVPNIVKSILPDGILDVVEESEYNTKTNVHKFKVFPPGYEKKFKIDGITHYMEAGENKSKRKYELEIKVGVPLIGGAVESQVAKSYKKNLERDVQKLIEFIKENS